MSHVVTTSVILIEDDTKATLVITCKKSGVVIDVAGKQLKLRMKMAGTVIPEKTIEPSTPTTDGKFKYTFVADEIAAGGILEGDASLRDTADGKQISSQETFLISLRPRKAAS